MRTETIAERAALIVQADPGCTTREVADRLGLPLEQVAEVMYRTGRARGIGQDLSERWWSARDNPVVDERLRAGLAPGFQPLPPVESGDDLR